MDATFHPPEWHAARIAALTTERMSWEDWKKQQKEEAQSAEAQVRSFTCTHCSLHSLAHGTMQAQLPCTLHAFQERRC